MFFPGVRKVPASGIKLAKPLTLEGVVNIVMAIDIRIAVTSVQLKAAFEDLMVTHTRFEDFIRNYLGS